MKCLKGNTIPGICCIVFGVLFLVPALSMGFFTKLEHQPGTGFFPILISICLIAVGISLTVSGIAAKGTVQFFRITDEIRQNLKIFRMYVLLLAGFTAVWRLVNFELGAFLFCILMNRYLQRDWKFTIAFSTCFIALIHVIFVIALRIQFA